MVKEDKNQDEPAPSEDEAELPSWFDVNDDGDDDDDELPPWLAEGADPELERLRPEINWGRPMMMIVIIIMAVYGMTLFQSQVEFFFSGSEPIPLGDITDFPGKVQADPDWQPDIPHNAYVSLSGLPTRMSVICTPPVRFFKLIGAHVYVELPMDDDMSTIACEADRKHDDPEFLRLEYFEGTGQAVSFAKAGRQYENVKMFYEEQYPEFFCSSLTPAKRAEQEKLIESFFREDHKRKTGAYPDAKKLAELVATEPICHNAYIIQAGKKPSDHWYYLVLEGLLILICLYNIYAMIRWARKVMPRA